MISVTQSAQDKLLTELLKNPNNIGIRFGVKPTGCSGFSYTIDPVITEHSADIKLIINSLNIYIDSGHVPYLEGMQVDYVKKGLNEIFEFTNSKEKARCGCGESFII